jgi:hypothetical protein
MRPPVGAQLQHAFLREEPVLPDEREPAAEFAGAAAVRNIAVAFDHQRVFGFDNLDRVVREIDDGTRRGFDPVPGRPPAPGPKQEFQKDEWPPLGVVTAKADSGVAAHLAGEDAIGRDLGERAEQCVGNAKAGQAARRDWGRHDRVDDRGFGGDDLNRPKIAFVVWRVAANQMADAGVDGGFGKGQRRVDRSFHLRRGVGEIREEPVAGDGNRDPDRDRAGIDAVIVDPILKGVAAVRHRANGVARQPFRLIEERVGGTH